MAVVPVENCHVALLSLAEGFRTCQPPDMQSALQCLIAVINLPVPHKDLAQANLHIGRILFNCTSNYDIAQSHLEKAWQLSQPLPDAEDIKFEAVSILADLYVRINQPQNSKNVLRKCMQESPRNVYWHCKLIFQLSQIHIDEDDYASAVSLLSSGDEYCHQANAHYARILFIISKGMVLMISRRLPEVHPVLSTALQLIESWQGSVPKKEGLKVFFLVLQVCHHLNAGQVKSVKGPLKLLQQSIQNITTHQGEENIAANHPDNFEWMAKEHMCILVYLVTVLHSMQAGYMDKVQKYADKALLQIEKLKLIQDHPLLQSFQILLLEHIAMCRLVMGNKTLAVKETTQALQICWHNTRLRVRHKPVVNTLLGLYSMSMNCMLEAESQLTAVLRAPAAPELKVMASLNLAIVYMKMNRERELNDLLVKLNPEQLPSVSQSLKAAAYYVLGLNAFFQTRYNDAKRFLRETLKMANGEDLNRLTSCALVLLGHIFYSLGNSRESMNMVTPAMQLASKIPDVHVQLWAAALLKDLYRHCGDHVREQEAIGMHQNHSQHLYNEQLQASQLPEHGYIRWLGEE
ncbi:MAU2 chromatid cohesion factor -like protein [Halotydeus destructor]|nr:MAU2 chromatid cohesion factor -like protein [Halotydeus destructor]